jgi:hypothetical protein
MFYSYTYNGIIEIQYYDTNVQIATDYLQVVQAIDNKFRNNTEFGVVIE